MARRITPWLLSVQICATVWIVPAVCQDAGTMQGAFYGTGAEIAVVVHDGSGEPIAAAAMVSLYRGGTIPSGRSATSGGSAVFVVTSLGDFTIVVQAAGYQKAQKDISVPLPQHTQVDVYLRRDAENPNPVPGKPVLAPKAREAFDKGMQALSTEKLASAEKYLSEATRLAPGHPDVLYARGVLYLKQRNWPQAQDALEKVTQLDPTHARAFAALGMSLSDQGKYSAAITPLEKAQQLDSAIGWETHWVLAKAYYQHQQYSEALKTSQLAVQESQNKAPEIELLVAQSLTAVARYEDAAQTLRAFLRNHADHPEAAKARRWLQQLSSSGKVPPE